MYVLCYMIEYFVSMKYHRSMSRRNVEDYSLKHLINVSGRGSRAGNRMLPQSPRQPTSSSQQVQQVQQQVLTPSSECI